MKVDKQQVFRNHRSAWTVEEMQFVESHYGIMATIEISEHLGRTPTAIRLAARMLGCNQEQHVPWTDEEKEIIRTHYADGMGITYVSQLLPGRNRKSIFVMAAELGVKSARNWQAHECRILTEYYPDIGIKVAEKLPGRTTNAIKMKAVELGIKYHGKPESGVNLIKWSDEEWRLLERHLNTSSTKLMVLFPHRSQKAIRKAKARLREKLRNKTT